LSSYSSVGVSAVQAGTRILDQTVSCLQEISTLAGETTPDSVGKLIAWMGHEDPIARSEAGLALARTSAQLRRRARLGLHAWNKQSTELTFTGLLLQMRQALQDPNPLRRAAVAESLAHWDHETVVTFLSQAMEDREPLVRVSAASALGQIKDVAAVSVLTTALADSSMWVRRAAAAALGAVGVAQAVPALEKALRDPHQLVCCSAVMALGHIHTAKAREALERAASSPDAAIRWYAVRGLGQIGTSGSYPALQQLLEDDSALFGQAIADIAAEALDAIERRERGAFSRLRRSFYALRRRVQKRRQANGLQNGKNGQHSLP